MAWPGVGVGGGGALDMKCQGGASGDINNIKILKNHSGLK